MLNPINTVDVLKNNNSNMPTKKNNSKEITSKNVPENSISGKIIQESNSSLNVISTNNVTENQKEDIFWGHFDLNMSQAIEGNNFSSRSSISMSIDIFGYNKNGISEENKENLKDIFGGEDFNELKDSFFSLNGSDESLSNFSEEIDDLFGKISETLDMEEKFFEGSKKLIKFTALMFSSNLQINESNETAEIDEPTHSAFTDALSITARLYGMIGDTANMNKKANDAMLLEPSNTIKEFLGSITDKYSFGENENKNENNHDDLFKTLNRLSKLSQKFNDYL